MDGIGTDRRQSAVERARSFSPFLRETLVFPYLRGQEFCSAVFAHGGYAALTEAYAAPPTSCERFRIRTAGSA